MNSEKGGMIGAKVAFGGKTMPSCSTPASTSSEFSVASKAMKTQISTSPAPIIPTRLSRSSATLAKKRASPEGPDRGVSCGLPLSVVSLIESAPLP